MEKGSSIQICGLVGRSKELKTSMDSINEDKKEGTIYLIGDSANHYRNYNPERNAPSE